MLRPADGISMGNGIDMQVYGRPKAFTRVVVPTGQTSHQQGSLFKAMAIRMLVHCRQLALTQQSPAIVSRRVPCRPDRRAQRNNKEEGPH